MCVAHAYIMASYIYIYLEQNNILLSYYFLILAVLILIIFNISLWYLQYELYVFETWHGRCARISTLVFLNCHYFGCIKRNNIQTFSWGSYFEFPLLGHNNKKGNFLYSMQVTKLWKYLWNYDMAYPDVIDNKCLVIELCSTWLSFKLIKDIAILKWILIISTG